MWVAAIARAVLRPSWNAMKRDGLSRRKRSRTTGQYEKAIRNGAGIWHRARDVDSVVGCRYGCGWWCGWKFGRWLGWGPNCCASTGSDSPIAELKSIEPQHRPSAQRDAGLATDKSQHRFSLN